MTPTSIDRIELQLRREIYQRRHSSRGYSAENHYYLMDAERRLAAILREKHPRRCLVVDAASDPR